MSIKYRLFCKSCNDFTLFDTKDKLSDDKYCDTCHNMHEPVSINSIPNEKIKKQQIRYKNIIGGMYLDLLSNNIGQHAQRIIETDAGLNKEVKLKEIQRINEQEKIKEELEKYKHISRNDICLCGSNKKYKKCCLNKHIQFSIQ